MENIVIRKITANEVTDAMNLAVGFLPMKYTVKG